ncbi:MAG: protein jag [Clostridia bacterium]|nr:protein jag [Clostridia bacterium]
MSNIYEGRTTNEAIEKGLKELNVSRKQVDVKILESEDKRSFFNILTPRVVKVELIVKEGIEKSIKKEKIDISAESEIKAEENIRKFLDEFISKLPTNDLKYEIKNEKNDIFVDVKGEDTGYLIGYRGNVLNSLQVILNNIANNELNERARVLLNIGGYKEKREKDLKDLADKIAGTVIKKRKSITLEPMTSYERKIIHSKLQENSKVETHSIGEEPNRKIVVSLKK